MPHRFRTESGGRDDRMRNTRWSQVMLVRDGDTAQRSSALGTIARQYWKPIYAYLMRKGLTNEVAKDLTQGFFTDVVLGRDLVAKADPDRGKFRSFLLAAVNYYARDVWRKDSAAVRSPSSPLVSLEGLELVGLVESHDSKSPEAAFNRAWASDLLGRVLDEVRHQCGQADQMQHWEVFRARHVRPITDNVKPEPFADLCESLGIDGVDRAMTMDTTVKNKFGSALRRQVRRLVDRDDQVTDEINELMRILSHDSP